MNNKVTYTGETTLFYSYEKAYKLKQIKAIEDIYHDGKLIAAKGTIGGYVSTIDNMHGNSFVSEKGKLVGNAVIIGDVLVEGIVSENAYVAGTVFISNETSVVHNAIVIGDVFLDGHIVLLHNAIIKGKVRIDIDPEQHFIMRHNAVVQSTDEELIITITLIMKDTSLITGEGELEHSDLEDLGIIDGKQHIIINKTFARFNSHKLKEYSQVQFIEQVRYIEAPKS